MEIGSTEMSQPKYSETKTLTHSEIHESVTYENNYMLPYPRPTMSTRAMSFGMAVLVFGTISLIVIATTYQHV